MKTKADGRNGNHLAGMLLKVLRRLRALEAQVGIVVPAADYIEGEDK